MTSEIGKPWEQGDFARTENQQFYPHISAMVWWLGYSLSYLFVVVDGFSPRRATHHPKHLQFVFTVRRGTKTPYTTTQLKSWSLNSALESVANENPIAQELIQWTDVASFQADSLPNNDSDEILKVPLYPLSATYLPCSDTLHTLRNSEPRNIQMALDLDMGKYKEQLFCVVLMALDTGRVASTGTLMQLESIDIQTSPISPDEIQRIVVTCRPQAVVDIVYITNPQSMTLEKRLRKSKEYLEAHVKLRSVRDDVHINRKVDSLRTNYCAVRDLYRQESTIKDLPPFAQAKLKELLPDRRMEGSSFDWCLAQDWQTLCYTVREGRQIALVSDRNEFMVQTKIKQGGPLQLPIHISDLDPTARQNVQLMEQTAQVDWLSIKLDPAIDFQVLLQMESLDDQLEYLSFMIERERIRLENVIAGGVAVNETPKWK